MQEIYFRPHILACVFYAVFQALQADEQSVLEHHCLKH